MMQSFIKLTEISPAVLLASLCNIFLVLLCPEKDQNTVVETIHVDLLG